MLTNKTKGFLNSLKNLLGHKKSVFCSALRDRTHVQNLIRLYLSIFLHENNSFTNNNTAQKIKFSIKDFFSKCDQTRSFLRPQFFLDLVAFTEEILNETLHLLFNVMTKIQAGNKTKRYSPVYHSMKTYHHQFILI